MEGSARGRDSDGEIGGGIPREKWGEGGISGLMIKSFEVSLFIYQFYSNPLSDGMC